MTEPATPSITSITAIRIAIDEAYGFGPEYQPVVTDGNGVTIKFRLIRRVGHCDIDHNIEMSRAMNVHDFQDLARRTWAFLKLEHERCKLKEIAS